MIETVQENITHALPIAFKLGSIFAITLLMSVLIHFLMKSLYHRLSKTKHIWDDSLVSALSLPIQCFIWLYGLCSMLESFQTLTSYIVWTAHLPKVRLVGFAVFLVWFLLRYISGIETRLLAAKPRVKFSKASTLAMGRMLRIAVALLTALLVLQIIGIPLSGLLTFGGAGAVVIGLAGKGMLADYLGGLTIYTDATFAVGDWISSPDRQIEGSVDQIGWRQTRVLTIDRQPMYIPNNIFASLILKNASRRSHRRIHETIGIRYQDFSKMAVITKNCQAFLKQHPDIDTNQQYYARFTGFAPACLSLEISCLTTSVDNEEFYRIQEEVLLAIGDIILAQGANMACNTQTIEIPDGITLIDHQRSPS